MYRFRSRPALGVGVWCFIGLAGGALLAGAGPAEARVVVPEDACALVGVFVPSRWGMGDPQLEELLDGLARSHQDLAAMDSRAAATAAGSTRSTALPNPRLTYRYFAQTPETRVGPQRMSFELSQGIPWGGKRELAGEVTSRESRARYLDRDTRYLGLIAELKRAYYRAAFLQAALRLNAEEIALLERFEEIALTRYTTGQGIQQSVLKVQTAISRLQDRRSRLEQELRSRTLTLQRLSGAGPELVLEPIELPALGTPPEVQAASVQRHPASCAAQRRIEAARALKRSRDLDRRPDFRVGVGWTQVDGRTLATGGTTLPTDNGKDIVALTFGLDLPIRKRPLEAGRVEADLRVSAREAARRDTLDDLLRSARDAASRVETLQQRTDLYSRVILPQAEESLASAEAAYSTDRQGFLDLLDAERVLFEVRLNHRELQAEARIAAAELERSLGKPWPNPVPVAPVGENDDE